MSALTKIKIDLMENYKNKLIIFLFFLLSFLSYSSLASKINKVHQVNKTAEKVVLFNQDDPQFRSLFQCNKSFRYNISLGGIQTGTLQRNIIWQNNTAIINSKGNAKILGIGSTYTQITNLRWSREKQHFYTENFTQIITGLDSRNMAAKITNKGTFSEVVLDGEKSQYTTKKYPLYDLDTLGEQLRLELIKGTKIIDLYRQASDQIKHYQFKVIGKETINVKPWGKVETIRLNEIGEYEDTVLWFSPVHDYQLIKAKIDAFITPVVTLTAFNSECKQKNIR